MKPSYSLAGKRNVDREKSFWMKVDIQGEDDCWNWLGSSGDGRYGQFWIGNTFARAHRFSYELRYGKIPEGLVICHRCDNTWCVNPNHLFAGTHQDNEDDKKSKGRQVKGKNVFHVNKLSEDDVRSIRQSTDKYRELAKRFGVSDSMIYYIKSGRSWSWVK